MPETNETSTKIQTGIRLEPDLYDEIKIDAVRRRLSVSDLITEVMTEYLKKRQRKAEHNGALA